MVLISVTNSASVHHYVFLALDYWLYNRSGHWKGSPVSAAVLMAVFHDQLNCCKPCYLHWFYC